MQYVSFIAAEVDQVERGSLSEAQAKYAISTYAAQQLAISNALQIQQNQATLDAGVTLMQSAHPVSTIPMPAPPVNCTSRENPVTHITYTTCQ